MSDEGVTTGRSSPAARYSALSLSVLAALSASAVSLLVRLALDLQSLPELALARVVQLMPVPIFQWGISTFGGGAKPLLFAVLVLLEAGVLSALGYVWLRGARAKTLRAASLWMVGAVLLVLPGLLVWAEHAAGPLLTYSAWAAALLAASRFRALERQGGTDAVRRRLVFAGGLWAVLAVAGLAGGAWGLARRATITSLGVLPGRTPALTPTEDFYVVSKNVLDPSVDVSEWRLRLEGAVERPGEWTLEELRALPATEQIATMECISNPVGGNLISTGVWKGVRLSELLGRAGVRPGVRDVVSFCADGYTESLEMERAVSAEALLVYELNGEPLSQKHGAPLRLQAPGLYGLKSAKWVERLRVVNENYLGYWQRESNWTDSAAVHMECRIDYPPDGRFPINGAMLTGIAYTGLRGVSRVEVSTDDGETWDEAVLGPEIGPLAWRLWSYPWRPASPGTYSVRARAYDGEDNPQAEGTSLPRNRNAPLDGPVVTGEMGIHRLDLVITES